MCRRSKPEAEVFGACTGESQGINTHVQRSSSKKCSEEERARDKREHLVFCVQQLQIVKLSIFLRCKRTSSTKTSCPKSGSFLAFIRNKRAEQTQWLVVQEMHRPSAKICSRKAEGLIERKPEMRPQKKGLHQSSGISDMFYKYSLGKKKKPSHLTWPLLPNSTNICSLEETILARKLFCHNPPSPKAQTRRLWAIFHGPVALWA